MFDFLLKFYQSKKVGENQKRAQRQTVLTQTENQNQEAKEQVYPSMWREIQRIAHPVTFEALKHFYKLP